MHARGSRQIEKLSSNYQAEANLDGSNSYRESIEQTETFSMDRDSVEKLSRRTLETSMDRDCVNSCQEKKNKRLDR